MARRVLFLLMAVVALVCTGTSRAARIDSVYAFVDNCVVVDAEALTYKSSHWQLTTERPGYRGTGYLKHIGPERMCMAGKTKEDEFGKDFDGSCQGTYDERLHIPVKIEKRGLYFINIRNTHQKTPPGEWPFASGGDWGVWTHVEGRPLPVSFSHADNAGRWDWLQYGPKTAGYQFVGHSGQVLDPGLYEIYIAGFHRFFGVDLVTIYPAIGPNLYPARATDAQAALSPLVPAELTVDAALPRPTAKLHSPDVQLSVDRHGNLAGTGLEPKDRVVIVDPRGAGASFTWGRRERTTTGAGSAGVVLYRVIRSGVVLASGVVARSP